MKAKLRLGLTDGCGDESQGRVMKKDKLKPASPNEVGSFPIREDITVLPEVSADQIAEYRRIHKWLIEKMQSGWEDFSYNEFLDLVSDHLAQRNMKNCMRDNSEEDNAKMKSWLELKDQMLAEFVQNTVLPEV